MNSPTQIAEVSLTRPKRLIEIFADRYKVDPKKLMNTLKNTAFRQQDGKEVTDDQMMALMVVANQYHLNPFTKEIYAFPDKGGIVPIVGIDGWSRLLNENAQFDGMTFTYSDKPGQIDEHHKACPESITCIIHRKDREHPTEVTEFLDEVYRPPFVKNKGKQGEYVMAGPWQSHTKRMLRHKAMMQCARIAMGFTGIYDQDEAERIVAASDDYIDVTPTVVEDEPENATEALKKKIQENTKPASEIDQPTAKKDIGAPDEAEFFPEKPDAYSAEAEKPEPYIDPETGEVVPDDVGIKPEAKAEKPNPGSYLDAKEGRKPTKKKQ